MRFADETACIFASTVAPVPTRAEDEDTFLEDPILLDPIDDPGSDDQEATELDTGEDIDVLAESAGDNEPVELDLGTLVRLDEHRSDGADEHDSGFEVDPAVGLALPDALSADDGTEGLDDGAITVDESKFPTLETDDGAEGIAAEREIFLGSASDEAPVPLAAVAWRVLRPAASLEVCTALASASGSMVAASSDLLWFRNSSETPLRLAVDGSALTDLVVLGAGRDIALATTQSGQLFRRARFASQAEQLTRLREHHKPTPGRRAGLHFGGTLDSAEPRVLLWAQGGVLIDVLDAGERLDRIDLEGKPVAVARESATLVLAQGRERTLVTLDGSRPRARRMTGPALLAAQSEGPILASSGPAIALAELDRALLLSTDGGETFRRVAGTTGTTALVGARVAGAARFFAAVYRETTDQSEILLLDPELGEAVCIARLDGGAEPSVADPVDRGEWAKVLRLSWHAPSERLWAVGGFGVASFAAPDYA